MVKNLPIIARDLKDLSLMGREDPLEKGMETDSSILAWRIPCTQGNKQGGNGGRSLRLFIPPLLTMLPSHICCLDTPLDHSYCNKGEAPKVDLSNRYFSKDEHLVKTKP